MNNNSLYQSYYTKSSPILHYMINMLNINKNDLLFEPCGGDGVFIDEILQSFPNIKINIYELNLDAFQILKFKYIDNKNIHIKNTNTLVDNKIISHKILYDKIIGNPPYGLKFDINTKKIIQNIYSFLYTKESYTLFLYACIQCLKENGRLCFIIPDTFLYLHRHIAIRKYILLNTKIKELALFPSSFFPNVNFGYANLCIITLEKSSNSIDNLNNNITIRKNFKNVYELEHKESGYTEIIQQKTIYNSIDLALLSNKNKKLINLINNKQVSKIGDIAYCVTGFCSGDNKKYLRTANESLKNSKNYFLICTSQKNDFKLTEDESINGIKGTKCFIPIIKGENIEFIKPNNWYINWSTQAIIEYHNSTKCRFQNKKFYFQNGIAVPKIHSCKTTAALLDCRLFDQSVVGIFPKDTKLLYYLLAFFNSSVCTEIINIINPSATNSANYIKKIPFIQPSKIFRDTVDSIVNNIIILLENNIKNINIYKNKLDIMFSDLYENYKI